MKMRWQFPRRILVTVAISTGACAGDADDDAGMQESGSADASAGEGTTADGGATEGSATQADGSTGEGSATEGGTGSGETGTVPSTCPAGDFLDAECELGDECEHGDFACACVCGCDEGGAPEGPGYWECGYAREEHVLALSESTSVLDCVAKTMTTNATFVVDNVDGADSIDFGLRGLHLTQLTVGDLHHNCSGICSDGEPCPDADPIAVAAGTSAELVHQFGPASCDFADGIDLCTFCGTTGTLRTYWGVSGSGTGATGSTVFDVAITCP